MDELYCLYCMSPLGEREICPVCGTPAGTLGSDIALPHQLPPGTILQERYMVGRVLGAGGFGITYLGLDLRLKMKVAVKEYFPMNQAARNPSVSLQVISYTGSASDDFLRGKQRFLDEAKTLAMIANLQAIVGVRDVFPENNTAYIVMEYIQGTTFANLVKERGGRIAPEELFPTVEPLFHALSSVHNQGLIHRDIAPDNLMLENGRVRLLDFGCAREAGNQTMTVILKHGFAPLEQYQKSGQGPWTDVYALCATLYYCLTGQTPPRATDRIRNDPLIAPSKMGVALSPAQEQALLKGLAVEPEDRFQSVEELRAALYADGGKGTGGTGAGVKETGDKGTGGSKGTGNRNYGGKKGTDGNKNAGHKGNGGKDGPKIPKDDKKNKIGGGSKPGRKPQNWQTLAALGGIAAVLIIALIVSMLPKGDEVVGKKLTDTATTTGGTETNGTDTGGGLLGFLNPDNPATLSESDHMAQDLQDLMQDDSVTSVTIPSGLEVDLDQLSVTKPLQIEEGATLVADTITVEEGGSIQNSGTVVPGFLLRLRGSSADVYQGHGDLFCYICGCIWGDSEQAMSGISDDQRPKHVLVADEGAIEKEGIRVSSNADIENALAKGNTDIVVDGDLELNLTGDLSAEHILITENGSLRLSDQSSGILNCSVIVNRGSLSGAWSVGYKGALMNYGTLETTPNKDSKERGMKMDKSSLLLNFNQATLDGESALWNSSNLVNLPNASMTLRSLHVYRGSGLYNYGDMKVDVTKTGLNNGLDLHGGCTLRNSGKLSIEKDSRLVNSVATVENYGTMTLAEDAYFYNDNLYNHSGGTLTGTGVKTAGSGFIWGDGTVDLNGKGLTCQVNDDVYSEAQMAETEEKFLELMKDNDVKAVCIPAGADVTIQKTLFIEKPLLVQGTLRFGKDVMCYLYHCQFKVDTGGTFITSGMGVNDSSTVWLEGELQFNAAMDQAGWEFYIWDSNLIGRNGSLVMGENGFNGAESGFRNSVIAPPHLSIDSWHKLNVSDNAYFFLPGVSLPGGCECYVSEDSTIAACGADVTLRDLSMYGTLMADCGSLTLEGERVSIGGNLNIFSSDLHLKGNVDVSSKGSVMMNAWQDFNVIQESGRLSNRGTITLECSNVQLNNVNNSGTIRDGDGVVHEKSWP